MDRVKHHFSNVDISEPTGMHGFTSKIVSSPSPPLSSPSSPFLLFFVLLTRGKSGSSQALLSPLCVPTERWLILPAWRARGRLQLLPYVSSCPLRHGQQHPHQRHRGSVVSSRCFRAAGDLAAAVCRTSCVLFWRRGLLQVHVVLLTQVCW